MKASIPAVFFLLALSPFVFADDNNPQQQQQPQTQNNKTGNVSVKGNSQDPKNISFDGGIEQIFDLENDMLNPSDGTLRWKGKIFRIEDNVVFRERFEHYLSTPAPTDDAAEYEKIYNEVSRMLDMRGVKTRDRNKRILEAIDKVRELADFNDIDGGQSINIANVAYKAYLNSISANELKLHYGALQNSKEELRNKLDAKENSRRYKEKVDMGKANFREGSNGSKSAKIKNPSPGTVAPTLQQTYMLQDLVATEAAMKATKAERFALEKKSELEFQSSIAQYTAELRYRHAVLAQRFYNAIFSANARGQEIGKKEIKEYLPISNFAASIETVESMLNEAKGETNKYIRSAEAFYNSGKKYHAFRQVLNAFVIGEHLDPVIFYPTEQKQEFLELWLLCQELAKESETRELDAIEISLGKIKQIAPDFPEAEVRGKLRAAKQASSLEIMRAKAAFMMAAKQGSDEAMNEAINSVQETILLASKYWPQNPEIKELLDDILKQGNILSKLAPEFDRMVEEDKKREIFDRRIEFTAALMGDAERREKLEKIISEVAAVGMVLNQVQAQIAARNEYLAWDLLAKAEAINPEDSEVVMAKARLVPLVADYSRMLTKAAQEEEQKNFALALKHYLDAQKLNPASEICSQGIQRNAAALLEAKTGTPKQSDGNADENDFDF
ncbi:MAG: hypothetical protein K6B46_01655 [Opitutales bacterium]|nr:hypothetical protein [Opitutales bacterium]